MRPEDAKKLLGGFATGTLTAAEEQALYAAAMEDQELFDALANEQALRDLLRDPAAKARLLAAMDERPRAWWRSWKPAAVLAMAGVAAIAVVVGTRQAPERAVLVAKVEAPAAAVPQAPPSAAPAAPASRNARVDAGAVSRPASDSAMNAEPKAAPAAAPIEERREMAPVKAEQMRSVPAPALQSFTASPVAQDAQAPLPSARGLFLGSVQGPLRLQRVATLPAGQPPEQANSARIVGTVTDAAGGVVPAAEVVVTSAAGQQIKTTTNERGEFAAPSLQPATYRVSVSKSGFRPANLENVVLNPGVPATVNVQLAVGQIAETIEVSAAAGLVQAASATAGSTVGGSPLGLRYSISPRERNGTVTVRFTANVNGYLSLDGAPPVALTAMQPYTSPAIAGDEVRVIFARQPLLTVPAQVAPLTETAGNETFVVNPGGGPVVVTIPLRPR
jgi:protocatechuate 3,4-dioxygenase beta subunit